MIKVENLVTPSPEQFYTAIKGMRNAYKSTDKSDSLKECYNHGKDFEGECCKCSFQWTGECDDPWIYSGFVLGDADKHLLLNLCKAGTSHRKVLRQLPVIMDITAPLYWWKQMDQYKLGTVTNSESTMHCLTKEPFKLENFSIEHLPKQSWSLDGYMDVIPPVGYFKCNVVDLLNDYRNAYLRTNNIDYWYAINELLPQSYNQKRTWSANYEVLLNIVQQRKNHKLSEWNDFIDILLEHVPYLKEIVEEEDG